MSSFNDTTRLAIAELAIFLPLLAVVIFIAVRHGRRGLDGWGFLAAFCVLRLTSSGLQVGQQDSTSNTGSIVNSIGISALLLALSGVIHETAKSDQKHNVKVGWLISLLFHVAVVGGTVLAAIGGSNLAKPETQSSDHSGDASLQKAGYMVLLLTVLLLAIYSCFVFVRLHASRSRGNTAVALSLLKCTMAALPFAATRVLYGVVYTFSGSRDLSPVTGTFVVKLVLIFLVQLLATLLLVVGGVLSRNIKYDAAVGKQRTNESSA